MGKGRRPCCDKSMVRMGPWSPAEDSRLINFVQMHGHDNWHTLPKQAGLLRCGKSCRLRWINYLRPDVKRGNFTPDEEQTIINLHNSIGNKWSKIAFYLPARTDNEIKNFWNTHLKKRLKTEAKESSPSSSSITSTCGDNNNMEKIIITSDSATSNVLGFSNKDDGILIEIPSESDIEIWELLDPLESTKEEEDTRFDNEVEFSKWLNFMESELGLKT